MKIHNEKEMKYIYIQIRKMYENKNTDEYNKNMQMKKRKEIK